MSETLKQTDEKPVFKRVGVDIGGPLPVSHEAFKRTLGDVIPPEGSQNGPDIGLPLPDRYFRNLHGRLVNEITDLPQHETIRGDMKDYEPITPEHLTEMKRRIDVVSSEIPGAIFVGGTALRIHAENAGLPIPDQFGGDTDITIEDQKNYEVNRSTSAGWVDVFPTPKEEGFYSEVEYDGKKLNVATPAHLLFYKLRSVRNRLDEKGTVMRKDVVYLEMLEKMCSEAEWQEYLRTAAKARPELSEDKLVDLVAETRQKVKDCIETGKVSDAVHPEND